MVRVDASWTVFGCLREWRKRGYDVRKVELGGICVLIGFYAFDGFGRVCSGQEV